MTLVPSVRTVRLDDDENETIVEDSHDAVNAAAVLDLHLVLLNANVVVAVVHVDASILGSQPHGRLIDVFLRVGVVEARYVATDGSHGARVRAWNVVRVRVVGTRATAKCEPQSERYVVAGTFASFRFAVSTTLFARLIAGLRP